MSKLPNRKVENSSTMLM